MDKKEGKIMSNLTKYLNIITLVITVINKIKEIFSNQQSDEINNFPVESSPPLQGETKNETQENVYEKVQEALQQDSK